MLGNQTMSSWLVPESMLGNQGMSLTEGIHARHLSVSGQEYISRVRNPDVFCWNGSADFFLD